MRLKHLSVKNFRALEEIEVEFENRVNVIVGPNGVGKTTVLEAIRFVKAILAPRTINETSQVLFALGAAVPYDPNRFIPEGIAREFTRQIEIRCRYALTSNEMEILEKAIPQLATDTALRDFGIGFQNPSLGIGFLSSPQGRAALSAAEGALNKSLDSLRAANNICRLELTIDPSTGRFDTGRDSSGAIFVGYLDRRLSPQHTVFSYFPADRALPSVEQPVQLGLPDANQQLESHSSQPQLKYGRLKNAIFNAVVTSEAERQELNNEFRRIFTGVLKGKEISSVGVNKHGLLSIEVKDSETGKAFPLDSMSSGEKSLILTFLIMGRSLAEGGIVLLDEPELHLNPAACKNLVSFIVEEYAMRKDLQVIVCSHSPEILAGAFDKEQCGLFHLISEKSLEPLRRSDRDDVSDALNKLGTSEGEGLLYKATIFVEGEEDVELLEVGFGDLLRKHKIKSLGGRNEVEKQIKLLQAAERNGEKLAPRYFIFDRDDKPADLASSPAVKILQWARRSLENYLIEIDILSELFKSPEIVQTPISRSAEVSRLLKDLAKSQLTDYVARKVYERCSFTNPGFRSSEVEGKDLTDISDILFNRLSEMRGELNRITDAWKAAFVGSCEKDVRELELLWDDKWREDCDGKKLFADLHKKIVFKMPIRRLKKRIMADMRAAQTENWRGIESLLLGLVGK